MSLYGIVLPLHSIVRWLVVIAALAALGRAVYALVSKKEWTDLDNRLGMLYTMSMDIQLLAGIILYFFASPLTTAMFSNFSAAMKNSDARFFGMEHIFMMVVAVVLAHVGRALSRKAQNAPAKHRAAAIWFGLSLLALLAGIPWFRPLLPFIG